MTFLSSYSRTKHNADVKNKISYIILQIILQLPGHEKQHYNYCALNWQVYFPWWCIVIRSSCRPNHLADVQQCWLPGERPTLTASRLWKCAHSTRLDTLSFLNCRLGFQFPSKPRKYSRFYTLLSVSHNMLTSLKSSTNNANSPTFQQYLNMSNGHFQITMRSVSLALECGQRLWMHSNIAILCLPPFYLSFSFSYFSL